MSTFTRAETEYLTKGLLGRLATVGPDGRPHVTPLAVFFDPRDQTLVIGGHAGSNMAASKKFRDAQRHPDVAVVVDDVASVDPWTPRYVEIRGHEETHLEGGEEVGKRLGARSRSIPRGSGSARGGFWPSASRPRTSSPHVTWRRRVG
jgi:pyridoxamine 5'-phosphate oxidase family protein